MSSKRWSTKDQNARGQILYWKVCSAFFFYHWRFIGDRRINDGGSIGKCEMSNEPQVMDI